MIRLRHVLHARTLAIGALASWPSTLLADVCAVERPDWDGAPVSGLDETVMLAGSLPSLALILVTALAVRFRNQWAGLAAVSGWSLLIYFLTFSGPAAATRQIAAAEGCVGSPTLFIAIVTAMSIATILYTAPTTAKSKE
ncbi:hypothetical protein [Antarctobacter jejuensis]|uniref:hypothetical protein n=1 Tax=Antarctobacter jejuensis TaxID=1439938 RepID=UPI003FCF8DEC